MIELITQHLETFISVFVAIGGTAIFTVRATKKKADADAMKSVQEVYQATIKDLREDKDFMNKELLQLRDRVAGIYKELGSLRKYKCTVMDCSNRKTDDDRKNENITINGSNSGVVGNNGTVGNIGCNNVNNNTNGES